MLKEAKQWVADLEKTLNDMAEEYGKTVEEMDKVFEDFYENGGSEYDYGPGPSTFEAFRTSYKLRLEEGEFDEEDDDGEEG